MLDFNDILVYICIIKLTINIMKELAIKFKQTRERHGLSQRDLAKRANIMQCTISRYENGQQNITFETALKLAKALNDNDLINAIQINVISKFQ